VVVEAAAVNQSDWINESSDRGHDFDRLILNNVRVEDEFN
jgi:hypothetical protein